MTSRGTSPRGCVCIPARNTKLAKLSQKFDQKYIQTGISSISSAHDPISVASQTLVSRLNQSSILTLVSQEGPEGHLLLFFLLGRCIVDKSVIYSWCEGIGRGSLVDLRIEGKIEDVAYP